MNHPTAERESPAQFADRARLGESNWSIDAKRGLPENHRRNQARIEPFEVEHETPEEIAAIEADDARRREQSLRYEADREADRRRELAMENERRRRSMAEAQAKHRREQDRQTRKAEILEAKHRAAVADAELKECMLAAKRNPSAEAEAPEIVEAALATRLFDQANPPPPPVPTLRLGDATVCTPGNVSNIQAPAKAGKSAVVGAVVGAILNGNRQGQDTLGFSAHERHPVSCLSLNLKVKNQKHDHKKPHG